MIFINGNPYASLQKLEKLLDAQYCVMLQGLDVNTKQNAVFCFSPSLE